MQYIKNAPPFSQGALQIAGNAACGPLVDGRRQKVRSSKATSAGGQPTAMAL
jgi:hypothetical protein